MMNLEKTIGIVTKGKSVMVDMETGEYLGNCRLEQKDDKNFQVLLKRDKQQVLCKTTA